MQDISTKALGGVLSPAEFNDIPTEMETAITDTGQTLSGADLAQLSKAMAVYAASGDYYDDSGAVNAYVLSPVGTKKGITAYGNGMRFRFIPDNTNTGASTVNVNTVGVVDIVLNGNPLTGGELPSGQTVTLRYDSASGDCYIESVTNNVFVDEFKLSPIGWRLDLAEYSGKSFSVTTQETAPQSIAFKPDGLACYIVGVSNDTIYQYTLSTAWDISTASYATKSFSVATQDTVPTGLAFKPDGASCYVIGGSNDTIYQYTLSTPWDVSTASYASKSFSVATQETNPNGLFFKTDGASCYVIGDINDTIYQYTLSTPWDISTASYATKSFSVATQEADPKSIFFKPDGLACYIVGISNDTIYQYTLSTPWDISTASYASKSFSVAAQETNPTGLAFKPDGLACYVIGDTNDTIYQYSTNFIGV